MGGELKTYRCAEQSDQPRPANCSDLAAYFIELNLAQHPDPPEREFLVGLPTSLRLDREAVDRVIAAAATILDQSEDSKSSCVTWQLWMDFRTPLRE